VQPAAADKGRLAMTIRAEVLPKVDQRWRRRLGSKLARLSPALAELASTPAVAMPEGLSSGWMVGDWRQFPLHLHRVGQLFTGGPPRQCAACSHHGLRSPDTHPDRHRRQHPAHGRAFRDAGLGPGLALGDLVPDSAASGHDPHKPAPGLSGHQPERTGQVPAPDTGGRATPGRALSPHSRHRGDARLVPGRS
jgi:hypothetical protein